ncbi:unnamed protein product [Urochloa decumbens]|uniref:Late embryogenesis abundant protein LEA-2 subgroup domain-containing protein n=1 Tax=Urochloa decumbens TaxID=240449 RepID=A0ABC9GNW1_9POAL
MSNTNTANCHCTLGPRTWVWQWTRGGEPVSRWVDTRNFVFTDIDGEQPDNRPCGAKVAGFICSTIGNLIGSVLTVFLLWLIFFRPYKVRPYVDAAALTAFDLAVVPAAGGPNNTNATALLYDLALNVTFFNDHRIYGIRFDHLTAGLYYGGAKIGPSDDTLPAFKLHTRRHRTVYPALRGRASNVSAAVAEQLAADRAQGRFGADVRVKTTLTYRFWPHRATYYYEYDCWLQFAPPPGNGTPAVTGGVKCGIHK